jgi:small-conductance mechanosensitive channel
MVEQVILAAVPPGLSDILQNLEWQTVVKAVFVILLGWSANKISNILIHRGMEQRHADEHATKTAKKFSALVIYLITFMFVLGVFGVPLNSIGAAIGLIGLGISFALKDLIANFISGMFILINRPFKIGDQIEVQGMEGTVRDIRIRATTVKTYDGRKMIVPNSVLYSNIVLNNTAYSQRRFEVIVGISYEDDIGKAREIAEQALEEAERTESYPEPKVLVKDLGDSSITLTLWGWTQPERADVLDAASEVTEIVKNRYDEEGIEIPFPIRTVIMDGSEEDVEEMNR